MTGRIKKSDLQELTGLSIGDGGKTPRDTEREGYHDLSLRRRVATASLIDGSSLASLLTRQREDELHSLTLFGLSDRFCFHVSPFIKAVILGHQRRR